MKRNVQHETLGCHRPQNESLTDILPSQTAANFSGEGTGYGGPFGKRVTLLKLNTETLHSSAARVTRLRVQITRLDPDQWQLHIQPEF